MVAGAGFFAGVDVMAALGVDGLAAPPEDPWFAG